MDFRNQQAGVGADGKDQVFSCTVITFLAILLKGICDKTGQFRTAQRGKSDDSPLLFNRAVEFFTPIRLSGAVKKENGGFRYRGEIADQAFIRFSPPQQGRKVTDDDQAFVGHKRLGFRISYELVNGGIRQDGFIQCFHTFRKNCTAQFRKRILFQVFLISLEQQHLRQGMLGKGTGKILTIHEKTSEAIRVQDTG